MISWHALRDLRPAWSQLCGRNTTVFMAIILCLKNNHINQKPASKPSIRWCKLQLIYTLLYLQTPEISLLLNQFFVIHFFCLSKLSRYKLEAQKFAWLLHAKFSVFKKKSNFEWVFLKCDSKIFLESSHPKVLTEILRFKVHQENPSRSVLFLDSICTLLRTCT